jgi:hypothetical protein
VNISAAGNVVVPAYLVLKAKGYHVSCSRSTDDTEWWTAEGRLGTFQGNDPITLLGIVAVAESRGSAWQADDAEIAEFLKFFGYE